MCIQGAARIMFAKSHTMVLNRKARARRLRTFSWPIFIISVVNVVGNSAMDHIAVRSPRIMFGDLQWLQPTCWRLRDRSRVRRERRCDEHTRNAHRHLSRPGIYHRTQRPSVRAAHYLLQNKIILCFQLNALLNDSRTRNEYSTAVGWQGGMCVSISVH